MLKEHASPHILKKIIIEISNRISDISWFSLACCHLLADKSFYFKTIKYDSVLLNGEMKFSVFNELCFLHKKQCYSFDLSTDPGSNLNFSLFYILWFLITPFTTGYLKLEDARFASNSGETSQTLGIFPVNVAFHRAVAMWGDPVEILLLLPLHSGFIQLLPHIYSFFISAVIS